jgi:hypothetical protein
MEQLARLPNGDLPEHGMGRFRDARSGDFTYHAGALAGCSTYVATLRSRRMTACVLANSDTIAAGAAARTLLAAASGVDMVPRPPARDGLTAGLYVANEGGDFVEILGTDAGLQARFLGRPKTLIYAGGGVFLVEPTYYGISIERDGDDRLRLRRPGEVLSLKRTNVDALRLSVLGEARFANRALGIDIEFCGSEAVTRSLHGARRWRMQPLTAQGFRLRPDPVFLTDLPKVFEIGGWSRAPLDETQHLALWTPLNAALTFERV